MRVYAPCSKLRKTAPGMLDLREFFSNLKQCEHDPDRKKNERRHAFVVLFFYYSISHYAYYYILTTVVCHICTEYMKLNVWSTRLIRHATR